MGLAWVGLNFNLGFIVIGWVAGSCLFGLGCLGLKLNGIGPIFFDLEQSLHSLSFSRLLCPWQKALSLSLSESRPLSLDWSSLVDDIRRSTAEFLCKFSQFGYVLDVYLSKVKVADLYLVQLGMVRIVSQWKYYHIFFSWQLHSECLNHGHAACNYMCC